jgi:coproporphyrinogen III oxidase-like Fe-S oxidoreductase
VRAADAGIAAAEGRRSDPATLPAPGAAAPTAAPPRALYIHVPFCVSICPYCDFVVYAGAAARGPRARIAAFAAALDAEIELRARALDERFGRSRPALDSVYIGGGTPSLLSAHEVGGILDQVARRFGVAPGAEVTIEVNPGPDERGDLAGFVAAGVGRVSVGAQSLDDEELRTVGRRHRGADVVATVAAARAAGVASMSVDLLFDVPGQTVGSWERTLAGVTALGVDHVSSYALTLDDPSAEGLDGLLGDHLPLRTGARTWRERARQRQDDDRAAELYALADSALEAAGLPWYEISNHGRPGHESRHNGVYWSHGPYEALGPGAHAFDGETRRWNAARLEPYLRALVPADGAVPRLPPGGAERLDRPTHAAERVILALRTRRGASGDAVRDAGAGAAVSWAVEQGLASDGADRVTLTLRGRLLSNELFSRVLPATRHAA